MKGSIDPQPIGESNDRAFERFIRGESAIYCGGAINNLLIWTWWAGNPSSRVVELMNHDDIAQGLRVKGSRSLEQGFVENRLGFGAKGLQIKSRKVETDLVSLFRLVGRRLAEWAEHVMEHPTRLNGSAESCEAARHILRPRHSGSGRYAFVTRPTDPALLVQSSDRYYAENDGRRRAS